MKTLISYSIILMIHFSCSSVENNQKKAEQIDTTLDVLVKQLESANNKEDYKNIIDAFTLILRPDNGVKEYWSSNKKLHLLIGANGSKTDPTCEDVNLNINNEKYSIAIGGNGYSPDEGSQKSNGGSGGNVNVYSNKPFSGILIAIGGNGGHGSDIDEGKGFNGGNGGSVLCKCKPIKKYYIWSGAGGDGGDGRPGGNGGAGGAYSTPPKFPNN